MEAGSRGCDAARMTSQMTPYAAVGTAIKAQRQALGLSREALGAIAGGVSSSTIRRVERETVAPHPSTVAALTRALDAVARGERARTQQRPGDNRGVAKVVRGDRDAGYQRP